MDTIYDLASLSKLFTSTAAVQLIQQGRLPLDETVVRYLPAFDNNGKGDITILQLLTHVSGLPPDPSPPLWTYQTMAERVHAVMTTVPQAGRDAVHLLRPQHDHPAVRGGGDHRPDPGRAGS